MKRSTSTLTTRTAEGGLRFLWTLFGKSFSMDRPEGQRKTVNRSGCHLYLRVRDGGRCLGHEQFPRRTFGENYLEQAREGGRAWSTDVQSKLWEEARKYVDALTDGFEDRVAMYYVLKRANGDVDLRKPINKEMAADVRLERSWPVLSVTELREVAVEGEAAEEGGGGQAEAGKGMGQSGLGEYGEYEGGVAGGIGIALAAGGYSAKASLYPPCRAKATTQVRALLGRAASRSARRRRPADEAPDRDHRAHAGDPQLHPVRSGLHHCGGAHRRRTGAAGHPLLHGRPRRGHHARGGAIGAVDKKGQFYFKPSRRWPSSTCSTWHASSRSSASSPSSCSSTSGAGPTPLSAGATISSSG